MNQTDATVLASTLEQIDSVADATVVHFEEKGGTEYSDPESHGTPDDDLYGVSFYAFDAFIPKPVIDAVAAADCGGIYTHPDIGVVTP